MSVEEERLIASAIDQPVATNGTSSDHDTGWNDSNRRVYLQCGKSLVRSVET